MPLGVLRDEDSRFASAPGLRCPVPDIVPFGISVLRPFQTLANSTMAVTVGDLDGQLCVGPGVDADLSQVKIHRVGAGKLDRKLHGCWCRLGSRRPCDDKSGRGENQHTKENAEGKFVKRRETFPC